MSGENTFQAWWENHLNLIMDTELENKYIIHRSEEGVNSSVLLLNSQVAQLGAGSYVIKNGDSIKWKIANY